ncbi:MAG: hypothetical protein K0R82_3063 [Flavipsychrobacter sp.]|nr:hypothetical protein [Flavipsychrobacter sp.]
MLAGRAYAACPITAYAAQIVTQFLVAQVFLKKALHAQAISFLHFFRPCSSGVEDKRDAFPAQYLVIVNVVAP